MFRSEPFTPKPSSIRSFMVSGVTITTSAVAPARTRRTTVPAGA